MNDGKYDLAIKDFNQAILFSPDDITPYVNRGYAYLEMKDWNRAIADFETALTLNPTKEHIAAIERWINDIKEERGR